MCERQTRAVCLAADTMAYFSPLQTVAADYYISRRSGVIFWYGSDYSKRYPLVASVAGGDVPSIVELGGTSAAC